VERNSKALWLALLGLFALLGLRLDAQLPPSQRVADAAMARWPAGQKSIDGLGTLLDGIRAVWANTADGRYYNYIKASVDPLIPAGGWIVFPTHDEDRKLDDALPGRQLMLLYGVTQDKTYANGAKLVYLTIEQELQRGTWPSQLNRAAPFYAEYAATFDHPDAFKEIALQFGRSGKEVASSPLRASEMAQRMRSLVDTVDYFPADDEGRAQVLAQLERDAAAIAKDQDRATGLWRRVLSQPQSQANSVDLIASCTIISALAKGVRRGYLHIIYLANAQRAYEGIRNLGENAMLADPQTAGAFILAATEMETAANARLGRGKTILLDAWFNSQKRADAFGRQVSFHYKWNDLSDSGFWLLGHIFRSFGAATDTLYGPPTPEALSKAQVYIIVSPDIPVKNPNPNYMRSEDAAVIASWVKAGGVLMIFENDPANADLDHMNLLADRLGIDFNSVLRKHVIGDNWAMGRVAVQPGGPIFQNAHTIYMKDVSTITATAPAVAQLVDSGDILMATAKYGRGTVFAVTDPWLYNEYTDGRKLPMEFDNFAAGKEVVRWVLSQIPSTK
jgi:unsaturated rhamnogalacturonyl hydrolase